MRYCLQHLKSEELDVEPANFVSPLHSESLWLPLNYGGPNRRLDPR
jgi:hypothetical protein